jgi:hypothetical protein
MAEYRAYLVGIDGHFVRYEPLVCMNDDDAIAQAQRLVDGHAVEVWSGSRLVALLCKKGVANVESGALKGLSSELKPPE